ncbi:MAG: cupin domain-containing protein [Acidobacteriota bacterium]|nr:cupin domain-containing protein [Acidobacteriota bacterium]
MTIPPGGGSGESYTHAGEEFLYVFEGCVEVTLDEIEIHLLEEGDAMIFPSDLAHRLRNPGDTTARALWINTPPTF